MTVNGAGPCRAKSRRCIRPCRGRHIFCSHQHLQELTRRFVNLGQKFATRCCRFGLAEFVHSRFGHPFATGLLDAGGPF